jgi:predicted ATPase with chaperone activity
VQGFYGKIVFPARFRLVASMNLCPCGAQGDPAAEVLVLCSIARARVPRNKLRDDGPLIG